MYLETRSQAFEMIESKDQSRKAFLWQSSHTSGKCKTLGQDLSLYFFCGILRYFAYSMYSVQKKTVYSVLSEYTAKK